jgi:hypothetical protein
MGMFIKTVKKKNKYSPRTFEYQYLVESVRAAEGPRQKFLLNLGKLGLPEAEWPLLAKRIEEILRGQEKLFAANPAIERLATHYAATLLRKYETEYRELEEKHYESVDLESITSSKLRTMGAEYVALSYFKKLELDKCLRECGFSDRELEVASLLIIGRLVSPGSERHTHLWGQKISGLEELLSTNFNQLSKLDFIHLEYVKVQSKLWSYSIRRNDHCLLCHQNLLSLLLLLNHSFPIAFGHKCRCWSSAPSSRRASAP